MAWLQDEISAAYAKAQRAGQKFSVRLNGTSDLSPEQFHTGGKNILEMFPDVQFYDYTKVYKRIQLTKKYSNYDITFSYSGENMVSTVAALAEGVRAAMVFDQLPEEFLGYPVIDGDAYDMRYIDPSNVIIGLKYKKVRNKLSDSHKDFVISTK